MNKSRIPRRRATVRSDVFRTPARTERLLGLWVDRIGRQAGERAAPGQPTRILGLYAAVAVEEGGGWLETGAGRTPVAAGDVILVGPDHAHRYFPARTWSTCWVVWGGPEADVLADLMGEADEARVVADRAPLVRACWQTLRDLMPREDASSAIARKVLLLDLVAALARGGGREHPAVAAAIAALSAGQAPNRVGSLARTHGLSPAHLRRLFTATTGVSPKAYQQLQRINRAKARLAAGATIKAVADDLGFADVCHFMRTFHRVAGVTAGQFRGATGGQRVADSLYSNASRSASR